MSGSGTTYEVLVEVPANKPQEIFKIMGSVNTYNRAEMYADSLLDMGHKKVKIKRVKKQTIVTIQSEGK